MVLIGGLIVGVVAGLIVGGIGPSFWPWSDSDHGAAEAATTADPADITEAPSPVTAAPSLDPGPVPEAPGAAKVAEGAVVPDMSVENLKTEVALGETHTTEGAAAAFTSYSVWVVGSPAASEEPEAAAEAIGGELINPADERLLAGMQRAPGDSFDAAKGAYRVLGFAGDRAKPDEVMVEVAAPLTVGSKTRWAVIGGVVGWTSDGWKVRSIRPREIPQPQSSEVRSFTKKERQRTLEGLKWQAFAGEAEQ